PASRTESSQNTSDIGERGSHTSHRVFRLGFVFEAETAGVAGILQRFQDIADGQHALPDFAVGMAAYVAQILHVHIDQAILALSNRLDYIDTCACGIPDVNAEPDARIERTD